MVGPGRGGGARGGKGAAAAGGVCARGRRAGISAPPGRPSPLLLAAAGRANRERRLELRLRAEPEISGDTAHTTGYSPRRKRPSLEAGEFSLLEAVGFLVSCPVSGLSFAAFSPNQMPDGCGPRRLEMGQPSHLRSFSTDITDAPAGLGTVQGSVKPDPYLVPLHWGHTKASHPDSDNKSQLMFPVGPEEACLGQPRGASGGRGAQSKWTRLKRPCVCSAAWGSKASR
ncbi:uncharacterized protein LOC123382915 isoform X1 [Felis catus]|uniref:uncharacterized protein LOC123382915 isoform X1 n=1 Tax=Felis catus TaxID=9685 RepID=UPI001D1A1FD1|nr:uncharacterized protein LOC123382915 isoform X1 [Felis catus]